MHFMGSPDRLKIGVVCIANELKALVDKDIMDKKIGHAIQRDAQAYPKQVVVALSHSQVQADDSGYSKNQKEEIIVLKEAGRFFLVVVLVEVPKDAMHDVFMRKPSHAFHGHKGKQYDKNVN